MRAPCRRLALVAGTARQPPLGRQKAVPGDQRPPPTPPPLPLRPKSGRRQTEETAAPQPPQRGRCTRGEGAPRPRQAPPVNRPYPPALPAADRRRTGDAQDSAHGAAYSEAGLGKTEARTRAGGNPHGTSIPRGGHAYAQRGGGAGGGGAAHPPPPPATPPQLEGHRSDPPPPRSRGDAPPPPEGTATRGGGVMRLDLHTARPSPPCLLPPRGSRPTGEPAPSRQSCART